MGDETTNAQPAISIQSFEGDGKLQLIRNYSVGGFQINDDPVSGSVFLHARQSSRWSPQSVKDITLEAVMSGLGDLRPALILFGLGEAPKTRLWELHQDLRAMNIGMEVMSTAAACRTWNVLLSEGRDVAAGLLAVTE